MPLPGTARLKKMVRKAGNHLAPRPLILLYHRVTTLDGDPQQLAVSPEHFAQHLDVLKSNASVIPLAELLKWLPTGRWPRRAVVITFDDGYADNLIEAAPLLAKQQMPATFYLAAGCIGRQEEFFWDELERIFLRPGQLPREFKLQLGERVHSWETSPAERYYPADAQKHARWHVNDAGPTVRQTIYRTLCDFVRPLAPSVQKQVMDQIRTWAGTDRPARPTHQTLSKTQAVELSKLPGVDIGAHTIHHPFLSALSLPQQQREIFLSKSFLETLTGRRVHAFSYPYGSSDSFTPQTAELVTKAGFACCTTTIPGAIDAGCDPMQLPRFIVRDWEGAEFERQLRRWFIDG